MRNTLRRTSAPNRGGKVDSGSARWAPPRLPCRRRLRGALLGHRASVTGHPVRHEGCCRTCHRRRSRRSVLLVDNAAELVGASYPAPVPAVMIFRSGMGCQHIAAGPAHGRRDPWREACGARSPPGAIGSLHGAIASRPLFAPAGSDYRHGREV
jgi:hypothetical protein